MQQYSLDQATCFGGVDLGERQSRWLACSVYDLFSFGQLTFTVRAIGGCGCRVSAPLRDTVGQRSLGDLACFNGFLSHLESNVACTQGVLNGLSKNCSDRDAALVGLLRCTSHAVRLPPGVVLRQRKQSSTMPRHESPSATVRRKKRSRRSIVETYRVPRS